MEISTFLFAITTITWLAVALQSRHLGTERRDVALPGSMGGRCGSGAAVTPFA